MTEMLCSFLDTSTVGACTRGIDQVYIVPVTEVPGLSTVSLLLPRGEKLCPADEKPTSTTSLTSIASKFKSRQKSNTVALEIVTVHTIHC